MAESQPSSTNPESFPSSVPAEESVVPSSPLFCSKESLLSDPFAFEPTPTQQGRALRLPTGMSVVCSSLLFSLLGALLGGLRLHDSNRAILFNEGLLSHSADISFRYFVDTIQLAEQFAPIAVPRLQFGQQTCQSRIAVQRTNDARTRASLEHLQLIVAHICGLQLFDLSTNRFLHLRIR